ncbi:hypothetical protein OPQ81_003374 [Rhizoctonia solani]|nr:hypothetical protein OPQ81_003374 [Rhizoctonia solani]
MIVPDSTKSETTGHRSSARNQALLEQVDIPLSPPPYSVSIPSDNNHCHDGACSSQPTGFRTTASVRPNLPPRCNHFIDRKVLSGISGTWHVDTALEIPEHLLLPIPKFDGYWNREVQRTRKIRAGELTRHQEGIFDSKRNPPIPQVETRPNLMLATTNGAISSDIYVMSSDGLVRQAILVAQGFNGSVNLKIRAPPGQPLRIFASTTNGSIDIKIPSSFEGALKMSTTWGNVNISEAIQAKLTTFSSTPNASCGFIGDWQAQGFGAVINSTELVDNQSCREHRDPFAIWAGPIIEISSTNGSVSLSHTEEGALSTYIGHFMKAVRGLKDSWFDGGSQSRGPVGNNSPVPRPPALHPSQPGTGPTQSNGPFDKTNVGAFGSG